MLASGIPETAWIVIATLAAVALLIFIVKH